MAMSDLPASVHTVDLYVDGRFYCSMSREAYDREVFNAKPIVEALRGDVARLYASLAPDVSADAGSGSATCVCGHRASFHNLHLGCSGSHADSMPCMTFAGQEAASEDKGVDFTQARAEWLRRAGKQARESSVLPEEGS